MFRQISRLQARSSSPICHSERLHPKRAAQLKLRRALAAAAAQARRHSRAPSTALRLLRGAREAAPQRVRRRNKGGRTGCGSAAWRRTLRERRCCAGSAALLAAARASRYRRSASASATRPRRRALRSATASAMAAAAASAADVAASGRFARAAPSA